MRGLEFITGHMIYNPAYMYLQIPTENHQDRLIQIIGVLLLQGIFLEQGLSMKF